MDEIISQEAQNDVEFLLATVTSYQSIGIRIRLDGQNEEMTKRYKMLQVGKPVKEGDRVVVMKMSGTYVVLGAVNYPIYKSTISDLSTSTTSAAVVAFKVNQILAWMRTQGMIN